MKVPKIKLTYEFKVPAKDRVKVTTSNDAFKAIVEHYEPGTIELQETSFALLLNRANQVLGIVEIATGTASYCVMNTQKIAQAALLAHAQGVIVAHNHPSGALKPSDQDKSITSKIKEALKLFDISLLDHLIITSEGYLSMAYEALL